MGRKSRKGSVAPQAADIESTMRPGRSDRLNGLVVSRHMHIVLLKSSVMGATRAALLDFQPRIGTPVTASSFGV
jgi:hypothetical protein